MATTTKMLLMFYSAVHVMKTVLNVQVPQILNVPTAQLYVNFKMVHACA
jgi:hypothetical protein